ncbi:COP9 signalosome complex subunit 7a isoform X1 [Protopterus annectens]|uniref:COP9 signalosome complex subunit 7a isoform X1 n=1 Tax=Protopterus annectens TaxID=7888 RepID=UPI001CFA3261|nr:COP9 signalosome complex subunit 7a isoform X1 [Protopterus annectens]
MATEVKGGGQTLEQFLLLAKAARGAALANLVQQVLDVPGVYVFGELLDMPNVKELGEGPHERVHRLLTIFAYGTYRDYLANVSDLPALSENQKNKLRHLSIVSLAAKVKCIPYAVLLKELEMKNVRELEDLIIEAVYADVIQGKLDQRNQQLEVDYCVGRDIKQEDLGAIIKTLQEWCTGCETVLAGIEEQVSRANAYKEHQLKVKQQVEGEVANLKKTLKATTASAAAAVSPDPEQHMAEPGQNATAQDQRQTGKKQSKVKGLRGSGKIWSKSN